MKPTPIFLFLTVLLFLCSCNHSSEPNYILHNVEPLKTITVPFQKDNDILPWENQLYIINSVADIYDTQTEKFIEENPEWLKVDFSTKSIIAVREYISFFDHWKATKVISFLQYTEDDPKFDHWKKGEYSLVVENIYYPFDNAAGEDEGQDGICQVAFVTEKVPSDASIWLHVNTRIDL